jgi:hypothetical protein
MAKYITISSILATPSRAALEIKRYIENLYRVQGLSGSCDDEMMQLRVATEGFATTTGFSANQLIVSVEVLIWLGAKLADAIRLLPIVINIGQKENIALWHAAGVIIDAAMKTGISFSDSKSIAAIFANGCRGAGIDATEWRAPDGFPWHLIRD